MKQIILASGLILIAMAASTLGVAATEKVVVPAPQIEVSAAVQTEYLSITVFVDKTNNVRCYAVRSGISVANSCLPIKDSK